MYELLIECQHICLGGHWPVRSNLFLAPFSRMVRNTRRRVRRGGGTASEKRRKREAEKEKQKEQKEKARAAKARREEQAGQNERAAVAAQKEKEAEEAAKKKKEKEAAAEQRAEEEEEKAAERAAKKAAFNKERNAYEKSGRWTLKSAMKEVFGEWYTSEVKQAMGASSVSANRVKEIISDGNHQFDSKNMAQAQKRYWDACELMQVHCPFLDRKYKK